MTDSVQKLDIRRGATSASNAEADARCPGRHLAQKGIPHPDKSRYAESGSKVHAALACEDPAEQARLFAAMTSQERETFDDCRSLEKALVIGFFPEQPKILKVIRERSDGSTRLWARVPDGKGGFYEHSAQPDVIYRAGTRALIIEYKTLAGDVPSAPENLQLRDQAVLYRGNNMLLEELGTAVVQPLVTRKPVVCLYDKQALDRAEQEMFARVRASNDPSSPCTAGEVQCQHCLAKTRCVPYTQWAGASVPGMLSILDVPVASWTPDQCVIFLEKRKVAEKWLDTCLAEIEERMLREPDSIPGYFMKPGAVKETITNPQLVYERFAGLGGKLEDFMACIAVGKTKLRDRLAKVTGAKGRSLDDALSAVTKDAVTESQNKPSIAKRDL